MRIAISINTAWNIFNFRSGLIKRLIAEGHEVVAVAPRDAYVSRILDLGCLYEEVSLDHTGSHPIKDLRLLLAYYKIFKKIQPDVVLQYTIKPNIYGTMAASRLNIPVINNVSGLGTVFLQSGLVSFLALTLYRLAFRHATVTLFQNQDDERDFKSAIKLRDLVSDQLPGSGVDLQRFRPPDSRDAPERAFTFLMISRLILDKGIHEYIAAARMVKASYPNVRFLLVGKLDEAHVRGVTAQILQSWIDEGVVEYLGETDQIEEAIGPAHCVVLPSYREGTPKTLLESAAMGKPLITTDVPGCRNVVKDGYNGFLCRAKDADSLFHSMESMLKLSSDERHALGDNSRRLAEEKFDEQLVVDRYLHWIDKIHHS